MHTIETNMFLDELHWVVVTDSLRDLMQELILCMNNENDVTKDTACVAMGEHQKTR